MAENDQKREPTAEDVAKFLLDVLRKYTYLEQNVAVAFILKKFGPAFVHPGKAGFRINEDVLNHFREMYNESVKWNLQRKRWDWIGPTDEQPPEVDFEPWSSPPDSEHGEPQ